MEINKDHLENIENDFNAGVHYDLVLLGTGRNAPQYRIVFQCIDSYGSQFSYHEEVTFYAVDVETWSFDTDNDDLDFNDIKDKLFKVESQKVVKREWVKVNEVLK